MTEEERRLVMALATQGLPPAEFLELFRASTDGQQLCYELLMEAIQSKSADDVEWSLIVGCTFGFTDRHLDALLLLALEPWHVKHEDVITALGQLRTPKAVAVLRSVTQWIPGYLDFDESRALAVKAIWALGRIGGTEADIALGDLMDDPNQIIAAAATEQKRRRGSR